jgi:hypothetical protein
MSDAHILIKRAFDLMSDGNAEQAGEAFASAMEADGFEDLYEHVEDNAKTVSVSAVVEDDDVPAPTHGERELDDLLQVAKDEYPGIEQSYLTDGDVVEPQVKSPVTINT